MHMRDEILPGLQKYRSGSRRNKSNTRRVVPVPLSLVADYCRTIHKFETATYVRAGYIPYPTVRWIRGFGVVPVVGCVVFFGGGVDPPLPCTNYSMEMRDNEALLKRIMCQPNSRLTKTTLEDTAEASDTETHNVPAKQSPGLVLPTSLPLVSMHLSAEP